MSNSDDFSGGTLDGAWSVITPQGTSQGLGTSGDEAFLTLQTGAGNHDIWGFNNSARAMQEVADTDFAYEVRFLSTPTERYQMQGLLVEQDANNWIRFDTYSDGTSLRAFAAVTVDGVSSARISAVIAGGSALYLQVSRVGDEWTLRYSVDQVTWVTAGSFTHALEVTATGVFAGNTGGASGFTAQVDYFENSADPLTVEDGTPVVTNLPPEAQDDALAARADETTVIDAETLLANDTDLDGDALAITGVTQPENGTLTDNDDGTWSYTPDAGYVGADSFSYALTDGTVTDTATVSLTVSAPAALSSDDFSGGTLDGAWSVITPQGTSQGLGTSGDEAFLTLQTGAGNHDIWGFNNSARAMQEVADTDFAYEVRFLSTPTERYQMQGLLVEQDANNWIRFDTYSDGTSLRAFAAVTVDGVSSARISAVIAGGSALYLQVSRVGDEWTLRYSVDQVTWVTAGSFTHALEVTATGVFAGNTGGASGFTAQVDYFENSADPLTVEDGTPVVTNLPPEAQDDALAARADETTVIDAETLLANDTDLDGDALAITGVTQPENGTLTDNGDGTWSYTPDAGYVGADSFSYALTDGTVTDTATVSLTVSAPAALSSDDFSGGTLDGAWSVITPQGTSQGLGTSGDEAFLTLQTGAGNHDIWGFNNSARAMQEVADTDFAYEVRFLSTPTERYQMQGLLVEQDANNWIRFDTYSDGTSLRAFAAVTVDGVSSARISAVIAGGSALYLQVSRVGAEWTLRYSVDQVTWVTAGSFTHALEVTATGVFAGNTGGASGFTAQVDYFENSADPLTVEDGTPVVTNLPPEAQDDALAARADETTVIDAETLLANDTDLDGDALAITGVTQPENGTLTDNGDGTWSYTPDAGYVGADSFSYALTDGTVTDTATVSLTVSAPAALSSDDFSGGTLDGAWSVITPQGTSQGLGTSGDEAFLTLQTGAGNHDIWGFNNSARAMQEVADTDFAYEVRFLSTPTERYQMQGLLVEQDANNWIRFDTYSDGTSLRAFAAITLNGQSSTAFSTLVDPALVKYVRLERFGDTFSFAGSADGETWAVLGSLTHEIAISHAGVFSGSKGANYGHTALVDYFENRSDPIFTEDGVYGPPDAQDDALSVEPDAETVITTEELTGNDLEPDGEPLSVIAVGDPEHGTLVANNDGIFLYNPDPGYHGYDFFDYTVSDGTTSDTATVTLTVGTPPPPRFESDDFHTLALSGIWTVNYPSGTAFELGGDADDAFLQISTSGSDSFDLWGTTLDAARAMQDVTDEDFTLEARFLSTPTEEHQMQGFLVQQDEANWLRYDLYSDGRYLYAFAAVTEDGRSTVATKVRVDEAKQYLRLERVGDSFSFAYSEDGSAWTVAGSVTHAMTVDQTGIFAGSVGAAAALTARIDYVESGTDPILAEDDGYEPLPAPPVTGDDYFSTDPGTTLLFTEADLLSNDSDINRDPMTIVSFGNPTNGTVTDLGDGNYSYTPDSGFEGVEAFAYEVSDGSETSMGVVEILVDLFDAVSDDFSGETLAPHWQFEGIAGRASIGYDGPEAFASIVSPAGVPVSASGTMTTPRILQNVLDLDMQIAAGFLTEPALQYQEHGLLAIQDDGNWIRFDLAFTGSTLTLIVGMIEDGRTTYPLFKSIGSGKVEELRMTRDEDNWTFEYRGGGSDWIEAYTYERAMTLTQVGVFAGSTSFDGEVLGYTAHVDYFENSLEPIADEDGSYVPVNHAPLAVDDTFGVPDTVTFTYADLLANDYDPDVGDTLSVTSIGTPEFGVFTDNGGGTFTYVPDEGFEGLDSIAYTITDGVITASATVGFDVQEPINLWYGDVQSFGDPGQAQRWINILGNVAENVTELAYSLNGGVQRALSVGPDTRRLQETGDFNIDIDFDELDGSPTDDIVTVYATLDNGAVFTQNVTVQYAGPRDWERNYAIDWEAVTDIQDVVLVADGTWSVDASGVRPVDLGYDRLLVLGDQTWDNYEVNLTITTHDLQNVDPLGRDGGGFALGLLWDGHTEGRFANWQPASGYEPGASFFYTHLFKSHSYHQFSEVLGINKTSLTEGETYNFTVRVEQVGLYDRLYSLKVWDVEAPEPVEWTLQTLEEFSIDEAPATGSLYLNAHYFDVTFGDLTVTEITGNDIIQGDETDEILLAVDPVSTMPGRAEVDVFVGADGADLFVFGMGNETFYDDGVGGSGGTEDFGFIWDFEAGSDQIQLAGSAADYVLTEDLASVAQGTAIWRVGIEGDVDELIGIVNAIYGMDLTSDAFVYDDGFV